MIKYLFLFIFLLITSNVFAKQDENKPEQLQIQQYYFVMLVRGPNANDIDSLSLAKIQEGHMANLRKMGAEGKLKIAGPFGDDGNWRGIFIFDVASEDEVNELLKNDPAIQSGRLTYEIHQWWTEPGSCLNQKY